MPALIGGGDCSGEQASLGLPSSSAAVNNAPSTTPPCASRRSFRIHLRAPKGQKLRRARIYVNGHRVRTLKGRALRRTIRLRVKRATRVRVTAVTTRGKTITVRRTYRACR